MTVKLRSIDRWQRLKGKAIPLAGKPRTVTVHFNVTEKTVLKVLQDGGETLLRALEPFECPAAISWVVEGDCAVVADTSGEVWWATDDGQVLAFDVLTESFTKLEQRMEMTPEMEITILRANLKREQREKEVAQLLLLKEQRRQAAEANANTETGEIVDEAEVTPDPDTGTPEPATPAGDSTAPK
ncbi:MAG: hypothetical protein KJ944_19365 [Alphaproteobacteria bacterium]|nr:hypothetical protein [Alphaproteobacteria bacterium]MBU1560775.1 hypothetical protein [Alphaproteobacteria bacterium]MBU2304749.1 hypothetical protein [Alphaproteobacteria bacterium]MBU2370045.1 hypothetical protein [Alphaproteobacteria bacterium]